jgi:peptide/nickel transport system substrate-binding protein
MKRTWLFLGAALVALGLVAAGTAATKEGKSAATGQKASQGGTLIFGAEQEPTGLNLNLACCTLSWGQYIETPILRGAFLIRPDYTYKPDLISAAKTKVNPFRVTYTIRKQARWNSGNGNLPVTGQDFVFTWKTWMNPKNQVPGRAGYDQIRSAKVTNHGKTVTFTFRAPYADWRDMFTQVLPAKALAGQNFNKVWDHDLNNPKTGKPISDGPFMFKNWQQGSSLTIVRNPQYWGPKAHLNSIVFRFLTDTNTEIQQMRGREVDAIYPQPQLPLAGLRGQSGIKIQSSRGPNWEHIDLQMGPKGNPMLKKLWVRQAIAHAIDRQALTTLLFQKLTPGLKPLQNVMYMSNASQYQAHWQKWDYSPDKSASILKAHGCTKGDGGIYSCGGKKLAFKFTSTTGNQLRQLTFEYLQQQLKSAGIEIDSAFGPANVVFGPSVMEAGNYDMFLFAWQGSPDPAGNVEIWKCKGGQNFSGYCNPQVSKLLNQTNVTVQPAKRQTLFNKADAMMANDLPTIPLFQKPTFFVYSTSVHGMQDNSTNQGPTWNAEQWWLSK